LQEGSYGEFHIRQASAKQSQTWAGWDIWGSRTSVADCAKQSQFPAARIPHHFAVLSFHHSSPVPVVRNKATWLAWFTNGRFKVTVEGAWAQPPKEVV
jgi:hypothetical protein